MSESIKFFKDISKDDVTAAGGKGASLGEMTQAGINVSNGFVFLSSAFDKFISDNKLDSKIKEILSKVDHTNVKSVDKASENIQSLIKKIELDSSLKDEIEKSFRELDCEFVAVRSSATSEDSADAAWAGQLDTYLNTTSENLVDNVRACWASLFTSRAIYYRFEKNLIDTHISVAVVVQKMIQSEVSGIAFSVHPVTEDYNQLIIEAGFGLGEAVVSGSITPDSYVVTKDNREIVENYVSNQERKLVRVEEGNDWVDVTEGEVQKLSNEKILELADLIVKIEKHYGFPCDIEWALEDDKLHITQSRPITTLTNKESKLNGFEKESFDERDYEKIGSWPNSNYFIGLSLEADSGKYYSKMGFDFDVGKFLIFNDNVYREIDRNEDFKRIILSDYEKNVKKWIDYCKSQIEKCDDYIEEKKGINYEKYSNEELLESLKELHEVFRDEMIVLYSCLPIQDAAEECVMKNRKNLDFKDFRPIDRISAERLNDDLLSGKLNTEELLKKWGWYTLLTGRGHFMTKKELLGIKKNAKKTKKLVPSDDPIIRDIQMLMWLKFERIDIFNRLIYSFFPLYDEILKRFDLDAMKYLDVFLPGELEELLISGKIPENLDDRFENRGTIKSGDKIRNLSPEEIKTLEIEFNKSHEDEDVILGRGSSTGKAIGKVVLVRSRDDLKRLNKGDVLVASETMVEYEPYMRKTGGMIVEQGSLLCHTAIFSREFDIPTVIGVSNALNRFSEGDKVEVDADKGQVKILDK